MLELNDKGTYEEKFYSEPDDSSSSESQIVITTIDEQIKSYFKKNPEKLYDLSQRKFEELVAAILKDMGFDG